MYAFTFGVMIGVLLTSVIMTTAPSYHALARDAVAACEKELPRNQKCTVSATPPQPAPAR